MGAASRADAARFGSRTRVKICGITTRADAQAAAAAGADALGYNFVEGTPRFVGDQPDLLDACARPLFVSVVAVCRNLKDAPRAAIGAVQYYECGPPALPAPGDPLRIRAIRVGRTLDLAEIEQILNSEQPDALLLDTFRQEMLGGAGETFDWTIARRVRDAFDVPVMLAGGLTPENVGEAIDAVRPVAVDVSSGVEFAARRKDAGLMVRFVAAVRDADLEVRP